MAGQGKEHNGFKYILSVKDYFTKAAWFRELPDKSGMSANYRSSRMRAVCSGDRAECAGRPHGALPHDHRGATVRQRAGVQECAVRGVRQALEVQDSASEAAQP